MIPTNRNLNFYVDFNKCLLNKQKISYKLCKLNYLLGKENLKDAITTIYSEDGSEVFSVLNYLIAIRDSKENVLYKKNCIKIEDFFYTPELIYEFMKLSGLEEIFKNKNIKDLNDYVFGIEVGMDTHARKNRSGKAVELYFENILIENGLKKDLDFFIQKTNKDFDLDFGEDIKKFDFVIKTKINIYFIEINFFTTQGSKPNETDRSYISLSNKFKQFFDKKFIWITDGYGWHSSKNVLREAYNHICMYNFSNLDEFITKIKNENL